MTGRERQIYVAAEQVTARTGLSRLTLPRELDIPGHCRIVEAAHHYKAHVETGSARVLVDQTDFPGPTGQFVATAQTRGNVKRIQELCAEVERLVHGYGTRLVRRNCDKVRGVLESRPCL